MHGGGEMKKIFACFVLGVTFYAGIYSAFFVASKGWHDGKQSADIERDLKMIDYILEKQEVEK